MSRARTMTGETLRDEKTPQSPISPVSPTCTDATLTGDAIIEISEDDNGSARLSSKNEGGETAQPRKCLTRYTPFLAPKYMLPHVLS